MDILLNVFRLTAACKNYGYACNRTLFSHAGFILSIENVMVAAFFLRMTRLRRLRHGKQGQGNEMK
jgi:hypothetical protein